MEKQAHYTITEASEKLGVSEQTIRNWINKHNIGVKHEGNWYLSEEDIQKVMSGEYEDDREYIDVPEAAKIACMSSETIRSWIKDFGIGFKMAGRWKVSRDKLQEIIDGKITYDTQGRPKEK